MDADHRHELKTNELAEWIAHLPEFIKKNANQIIGVVLILAGILSWLVFRQKQQVGQIEEQSEVVSLIDLSEQSRYQTAQDQEASLQTSLNVVATSLGEKAQETENANLAALALIKQAESIRAELHFQDNPTDETISEQISQARTAYEKALESASMPALKGLAEVGLGLCAEEVGELDKARQLYEKIVSNPGYDATTIPEQARRRLESLEENAQPVFFVKAPEPEIEKAESAEPAAVEPQPAIPALESLEAPTPTMPLEPIPTTPESDQN